MMKKILVCFYALRCTLLTCKVLPTHLLRLLEISFDANSQFDFVKPELG